MSNCESLNTECGCDEQLLVEKEVKEILHDPGSQGPPGPQGPPGQAGVSFLTFTADGAIGGHRVVVPTVGDKVGYASNLNPVHTNSAIGLTINAAADGAEVNVQTNGEVVEPSWNWTLNLPVFLSTNGLLTQVYPTTGFVLIIGVPTSPTKLLIGIKLPFVLEN